MLGVRRTIVLLLFLLEDISGRNICVVRTGVKSRVLSVSAHVDGGIMPTGPFGYEGEGIRMRPLK